MELNLDTLKAKANLIYDENHKLIEGILLKEEFSYLSEFLNNIRRFLNGDKNNDRYNIVLKGQPDDLNALKEYLMASKTLRMKMISGSSTKELQSMMQTVKNAQRTFESLTGIYIPF